MISTNPLLLDPTRTGFQRRKLEGAVRARFASLKRKLWQLIVKDDALGLTTNANPEGHNQYWNPDAGTVFYRGTVPGSTARIDEPFTEAAGKLFAARSRESARHYGPQIEAIVAKPGARILHQESPQFWRILKRRRPPNSSLFSVPGGTIIDHVNTLVRRASAEGYDAVSFSSDSDIGTVILDESKFERNFTINASFWHFLTSDRKLEEFKKWIRMQLGISMGESEPQEDYWLKRYINETYQKAVARAYDGHRPLPPTRLSKEAGRAYQEGAKAEFLRKAFWHPVSASRVKALASQTMEEIKGLSEETSRRLTVELANGMIAGESPYKVGARLNKVIDGISNKGVTIAATRTVAAHNEGFLDSLELMGHKNVKVAVEWSTSGLGTTKKGNPSPCKLCAPLQGIVLTVEEAHGLLPRHPHCKCTFRPANVGESKTGQKRAQHSIQTAIRASVHMDRKSTWPGATKHIASRRPV